MLTVLESIKLSTEYLHKKGIESPRINAELLLSDILKCKRLDLYLKFDQPLKEDEIKTYRGYIGRRGKSEPLQYITGKVEFYGIEFRVNPSVLIPRQETEILIDAIIENVDKEKKLDILDIGTGSGNIAISLAKNLPCAVVTAIDDYPEALKTAVENAKTNFVENNIEFKQYNILNSHQYSVKKYDIIVSNPPYIPAGEFDQLQPELRLFEPRNALTDNEDGYKFFRIISEMANLILKEKGKLFFEAGKDQYKEILEIMERNNFKNLHVKKDYLNIERVIYGELK